MSGLVQVALPSPLYRLFDYRWAESTPPIRGARVLVPFGPRRLVGILIGCTERSEVPEAKLRAVHQVVDESAILPESLLSLLEWAAAYYHHPLGEVLATALPVLLRQGRPATLASREWFRLSNSEAAASRSAAVQTALLARLTSAAGEPVEEGELSSISPRWRTSIRALVDKGLVESFKVLDVPNNRAHGRAPELEPEQVQAVDAINSAAGRFTTFLLQGVTGSGKTEVYLQCIEATLARGQQALVVVPEISLTPQLAARFSERLNGCLVSLHSGLNDTQRLRNWLLVAEGHADVIIGTRSSVLVPLPRLGLVVIDEEHDGSLKQQDGFRYHARDLALMRARTAACPVVLGSATPAFETLHNAKTGRYEHLFLTQRAGGAVAPTLSLLDIRRRPLIEGMSDRLLDAIRRHLDDGGQAMVFLNRRGFAPTLLCNDCGAAADCLRCDAHMTVHLASNRLRCHHCGSERPIITQCGSCGSTELDRVGQGTERIAAALAEQFPDVPLARIDRDSTRRKGELTRQLALATCGEARLLVGTQMLAKGHHFPNLTLVGILDADRGLFGTDFRSLEHMGQLTLQVAGRAGRENRPGTVLVQTRNPDNPMLQTLVSEGYDAFAEASLIDRKLAELPPYSFVALVRAEAAQAQVALDFLTQVAELLQANAPASVYILGPAPAPMERLGGRFRAQLLLQSDKRSSLNHCLQHLTTQVSSLPDVRKARWSIDVDPVDLF